MIQCPDFYHYIKLCTFLLFYKVVGEVTCFKLWTMILHDFLEDCDTKVPNILIFNCQMIYKLSRWRASPAELNVITMRTILKYDISVTNFPENLSMSIITNLSTQQMLCAMFFNQLHNRKIKQVTYDIGRRSIELFWEAHPKVFTSWDSHLGSVFYPITLFIFRIKHSQTASTLIWASVVHL